MLDGTPTTPHEGDVFIGFASSSSRVERTLMSRRATPAYCHRNFTGNLKVLEHLEVSSV
jgi:hypothetical protein